MPESLSGFLLSLTIFLPLVGAVVLMALPRPSDEEDGHGHAVAPAPGTAWRGDRKSVV